MRVVSTPIGARRGHLAGRLPGLARVCRPRSVPEGSRNRRIGWPATRLGGDGDGQRPGFGGRIGRPSLFRPLSAPSTPLLALWLPRPAASGALSRPILASIRRMGGGSGGQRPASGGDGGGQRPDSAVGSVARACFGPSPCLPPPVSAVWRRPPACQGRSRARFRPQSGAWDATTAAQPGRKRVGRGSGRGAGRRQLPGARSPGGRAWVGGQGWVGGKMPPAGLLRRRSSTAHIHAHYQRRGGSFSRMGPIHESRSSEKRESHARSPVPVERADGSHPGESRSTEVGTSMPMWQIRAKHPRGGSGPVSGP